MRIFLLLLLVSYESYSNEISLSFAQNGWVFKDKVEESVSNKFIHKKLNWIKGSYRFGTIVKDPTSRELGVSSKAIAKFLCKNIRKYRDHYVHMEMKRYGEHETCLLYGGIGDISTVTIIWGNKENQSIKKHEIYLIFKTEKKDFILGSMKNIISNMKVSP